MAAITLGLPEHKLRVIAPDVGGGFGGKIGVLPEEATAILAAQKLGRPVKGKSSNPDFESTTIYLRKDVKHRAARILFEEKARGQDRGLSDVLEELLEAWVDKNS